MVSRFIDRYQAGRALASPLSRFKDQSDVLILALPRGGVPVGYALAKALNLPLDILIVRKLGLPWQPELAFGAISLDGRPALNPEIAIAVSEAEQQQIMQREQREIQRRNQCYRGSKAPPVIKGKTIILVDDGIATGASVRAALDWLKQQQPAEIVLAVPVLPAEMVPKFKSVCDDLIYLLAPRDFSAVGLWYEDFGQTSDEEVIMLLNECD